MGREVYSLPIGAFRKAGKDGKKCVFFAIFSRSMRKEVVPMHCEPRLWDAMRAVRLEPEVLTTAPGSVLCCFENTKVLCTVMADESVPPFAAAKNQGWLTAEYAMLPASTQTRKARDLGRADGRSSEIQRMIGRALRASVELEALWPYRLQVDCDVIQADGGTRTASITGAWVALALCQEKLLASGKIRAPFIRRAVAAVSVGYVGGELHLDLDYALDSRADVDMNVVMADDGSLIEVQGASEGKPFTRDQLGEMLDCAEKGLRHLFDCQKAAARPTLVIASNNEHKIRELEAILAPQYRVRSMRAALGQALEIEETGETFEENALIKARKVAELTGSAALADDSGLMVDALGGAPGVYSARFAGLGATDETNNRLLLDRLRGVTAGRTARFVSAVALVQPGQDDIVVTGQVEGTILDAPRGSSGFGYDPLFLYDPLAQTFAELSPQIKNQISHRAKALDALLRRLTAER